MLRESSPDPPPPHTPSRAPSRANRAERPQRPPPAPPSLPLSATSVASSKRRQLQHLEASSSAQGLANASPYRIGRFARLAAPPKARRFYRIAAPPPWSSSRCELLPHGRKWGQYDTCKGSCMLGEGVSACLTWQALARSQAGARRCAQAGGGRGGGGAQLDLRTGPDSPLDAERAAGRKNSSGRGRRNRAHQDHLPGAGRSRKAVRRRCTWGS